MKNTGKCPKCGQTNIITIPAESRLYNAVSGMTAFTLVYCQRFVCGECGFVEQWMANEDDIKVLKKRYPQQGAPEAP